MLRTAVYLGLLVCEKSYLKIPPPVGRAKIVYCIAKELETFSDSESPEKDYLRIGRLAVLNSPSRDQTH